MDISGLDYRFYYIDSLQKQFISEKMTRLCPGSVLFKEPPIKIHDFGENQTVYRQLLALPKQYTEDMIRESFEEIHKIIEISENMKQIVAGSRRSCEWTIILYDLVNKRKNSENREYIEMWLRNRGINIVSSDWIMIHINLEKYDLELLREILALNCVRTVEERIIVEKVAAIYTGDAVDPKIQKIVAAAKNNDKEAVMRYITEGGDIHAEFDALLACACFHGEIEIVQELILRGASVNAMNGMPLSRAIENGHLELTKWLVQHGAEFRNDDEWALQLAIDEVQPQIVKFLCESGADLHVNDDNLLLAAVLTGNYEIVKYLVIVHDLNVSIHNDAPLLLAVKNDFPNIARFLLEEGADFSVIGTIRNYHSWWNNNQRVQYNNNLNLSLRMTEMAEGWAVECEKRRSEMAKGKRLRNKY